MRIACPNCHTLYDVPDHLFGGRPRRLRCQNCGHGWRMTPDGVEEPATLPAAPLETASTEAPVTEAPAAQAAAPEEAPPGPVADPEMDETLNRRFGKPADEEAKAAVQAALKDEALAHPHPAAPMPPMLPPEPTLAAPAEADRFAELVRAARSNQMEMEPEAPRRQLKRGGGNPLLIVLLVILLILALIVLERHAIMRMLPGTAGLFHALHLS